MRIGVQFRVRARNGRSSRICVKVRIRISIMEAESVQAPTAIGSWETPYMRMQYRVKLMARVKPFQNSVSIPVREGQATF